MGYIVNGVNGVNSIKCTLHIAQCVVYANTLEQVQNVSTSQWILVMGLFFRDGKKFLAQWSVFITKRIGKSSKFQKKFIIRIKYEICFILTLQSKRITSTILNYPLKRCKGWSMILSIAENFIIKKF